MLEKNKNLIQVDQKLLPNHQKINRDFFLEYDNMYELFDAQVKKNPKKIFAIFPEYEKEFSYKDLEKEVAKRSSYLRDEKLSKGDRVALVLPTSPDFIVFLFAAFREGITVVTINPDLSAPEVEYIAKDSKAKAVFYDNQLSEKLKEVSSLDDVSFINTSKINTKTSAKNTKVADVHYTDEAVIIYTSGTTGKPKGAILSHMNFLADSQAISEWFEFTPNTKTLCILPLFHNNGQVITLFSPLYVGGSTVMVQSKTGLKSFWSLIKEYKVSWTSVMPAMLSIILGAKLQRRDSTMEGIICGGQVLNEEVKLQFENRYNVPIFEGYGLTETTSFACFNRFPAYNRKFGTVGQALPCNDILILDDEGKETSRGEEGEICMRGLNVMTGYFGLKEVNKKALRGDIFHSGDYGYMDNDGHIYFKTRKDYLIDKGGEKIYPSEIENVLFAHTAVDECAALGVPDKFLGQNIVAFVKLNSDCSESVLRKCFEAVQNSYNENQHHH